MYVCTLVGDNIGVICGEVEEAKKQILVIKYKCAFNIYVQIELRDIGIVYNITKLVICREKISDISSPRDIFYSQVIRVNGDILCENIPAFAFLAQHVWIGPLPPVGDATLCLSLDSVT